MIYYGSELLDLSKKSTDERSVNVKDEITQIKNKYFSGTGKGRVVLLYPNGKRKEKDDGFTVLKMFQIPLTSTDGMWRYSKSVKKLDGKFAEGHLGIKDRQVFKIKDIEFIWFLLNRSSVLNKYVFIEDLEEDAKEENNEKATDAYISYMLFDKRSPIHTNHEVIRQTAEVFGLRDSDRLGNEERKKILHEMLVKGEKTNDKYINFDKFDELVNGEIKRKAAYHARKSINDGVVGYRDGAWFLMAGRDYDEKLCTVARGEAAFREQAFIEEIVNNSSVRSRLFEAIGQAEYNTVEDFRDLTREVLLKMVREKTKEYNPKDTKENVVEKMCGIYNIEYKPPK